MKYWNTKDNKNLVILIKNLFDIWLNNILLNQLYFFTVQMQTLKQRYIWIVSWLGKKCLSKIFCLKIFNILFKISVLLLILSFNFYESTLDIRSKYNIYLLEISSWQHKPLELAIYYHKSLQERENKRWDYNLYLNSILDMSYLK